LVLDNVTNALFPAPVGSII